jgi:hypothetical protein
MPTPVYNQNPTGKNRPMGRKDAQGNLIPNSFEDQSFRGEYTGTDLIYKGFARPGSLEGDLVWQIAKMTYDGSHNLLSILWPEDANGHANNDYQFSWTLRATYTYA